MAHHDYPSLVLSFLLITLATTSGPVILADARNLLEINLPELPLPELPDLVDLPELPEPELPSLPKVELPHFPGLSELNFPTLPTVELPKISDLPSFPQFPKFSKPGVSTIHKDTPEPSLLWSGRQPDGRPLKPKLEQVEVDSGEINARVGDLFMSRNPWLACSIIKVLQSLRLLLHCTDSPSTPNYMDLSKYSTMSSCKFFISFILIALSIQGLDKASAAGNRRLLTPNFPGIPTLPFPSIPTLPSPSLFPPLFPSPYPDPETPAVPNLPQFPPTTFPGTPSSSPVVPYFPFSPPPPTFTSP
ncbi:hypothetical protein Pfo_002446 [Paulownia fortunei]|nr:hypothetical protein Pfo_002446 [Paulownia fortunei]